MKAHHLIILTTALFVVLFYGESMGVNLGILGIVYAVLTLYKTSEKNRTRTFLTLFVTSVFACFAFAWFGDFISFVAVVFSLLLLGFKSKTRNLKVLFIIPVMIMNFATFVFRIFNFTQWIPIKRTKGALQKIISIIIIPGIFLLIFFAVYTYGSDHFANVFSGFEWDINLFELTGLSLLGFVIAFNFWNFYIDRMIYQKNSFMNNEFRNEKIEIQPMFGFLSSDAQRVSGLVTFSALNILLLFFIVTYNYEQFYEISKSPNQLSAETHDRVNAVIMSIVMAIAIIMMYFKGGFNFDKNAGILKISAKIWIVLNAVLLISAMAKNTEYVSGFGLTYKRLGVYAFLIMSIIGLLVTFIKIQKRKTNAFLFNYMAWAFYGIILVCSFINWGGIVTAYNMKSTDFAGEFHQNSINFSEKKLFEYARKKQNVDLEKEILKKVNSNKQKSFLSKVLFYETIK